MAHEIDIRNAEFSLSETRVVENGEVDVFRAPGLEDVELQVLLKLDTDRAEEKQVTYEFIRFADKDGHPLHILDEEGATLDAEACQVLAFEIVEDDVESSMGYAYGRNRIRHENGTPAVMGDVIRHQREAPSFSM